MATSISRCLNGFGKLTGQGIPAEGISPECDDVAHIYMCLHMPHLQRLTPTIKWSREGKAHSLGKTTGAKATDVNESIN